MSSPMDFTSNQTAASEVDLGIVDIDSCDAKNQLAVVKYVEDLYNLYKLAKKSCRSADYMNSQFEIDAYMRCLVSECLIQVHKKFELRPETLYLAFHIMDRYISVEKIRRRELPLVGIASMFIACKYEEILPPNANELARGSGLAYDGQNILIMQCKILSKLEWSLTFPTIYMFLVRFIKASRGDKQEEDMAFFFSELALMHYTMIIYSPSMLAASAVYAARCTLRRQPLWTKNLEFHTGFQLHQLVDCAEKLMNFHSSAAAETKAIVVYRKYSDITYAAAALHPPAKKIFESLKNIFVRLLEKIIKID